jgi:hypothetical protein
MVYSISQVFDFGPSTPGRRLVIFSDLMQNVPGYSHFSAKLDYKEFRATPYAKRLAPNLNGVDIQVIYLLRPELYKYQSQPEHQTFWGHWFEESGAKEVSFQRAA